MSTKKLRDNRAPVAQRLNTDELAQCLEAADVIWDNTLKRCDQNLARTKNVKRLGKNAALNLSSNLGQVRCLIDLRISVALTVRRILEMTRTLPASETLSEDEQEEWRYGMTLAATSLMTEHSLLILERVLPYFLAWSLDVSWQHLFVLLSEIQHKQELKSGDARVASRREALFSSTSGEIRKRIEDLSKSLAQAANDVTQELKIDFGAMVLGTYNRTLKACRRLKREARSFLQTSNTKNISKEDFAKWDEKYAGIEVDIPLGIRLRPHDFLTKQASEIALSAVADFLGLQVTTLKTQILPKLRKSEA